MNPLNLKESRILIIDDETSTIELLCAILRGDGYVDIHATSKPLAAVETYRRIKPDIVLLDLLMEPVNGHDILTQLRAGSNSDEPVPIIVITADNRAASRLEALREGASEVLTKPFDEMEVLLRISNLLHVRAFHQRMRLEKLTLEERVRDRTNDLVRTQMEFLDRLAAAAEMRDDATGRHTTRVAELSAMMAQTMGWSEENVLLIRHAAPLHDIGKLSIPESCLLKPGPLTDTEYQLVKSHAVLGARFLAKTSHCDFPVMRMAEEIARTHHENWDGTGYNVGLRGEEIPISGRIVAVADVYDALTHDRPYKKAWSADRAFEAVRSMSETRFDPEVVVAFAAVAGNGLPYNLSNATPWPEESATR